MIKKLWTKLFGAKKQITPEEAREQLGLNAYNRDTLWGTYDGRWIKIRDLEDAHLANIIKHLYTYKYNDKLLRFMILESVLRGLTMEFLDRAYIPHKDSEGNWMLWSEELHRPIKVG